MVDSAVQTPTLSPLLETKLYVPRWRHDLVRRPRLVERMSQGVGRRLTLVSAPAGFGKTTLLTEWVASTPDGGRPTAWVSLDRNDNDPMVFWAYLIGALQTIKPGVGENALTWLHAPTPTPIESILTTLINEISTIDQEFALILDDYHVIEAQPIHTGIAFLLDYLPPQMQVIIASRADPPLPLSRLRGRGELIELRAADLRFTPDEATALLNRVTGMDLSDGDVQALETRTEGWAAGLQLAALSMQGRQDVPSFVSDFAGDDRYIVDYLLEEVLQRQSDHVRDFLLQTSVLDRLNGPLCDVVTGQNSGKVMLETLERGNLFVVPLDDKRGWYRYHHLFADVLHARTLEEEPEKVPTLHRRASDWYEKNGLLPDAIRHAIAAEDHERVADLIELAWPEMMRSDQNLTLYGWMNSLPDDLLPSRPVLSVGYGFMRMLNGDLEAAEPLLQSAERWLDLAAQSDSPPDEMIVVDQEQFGALPGTIATARSYLAGAFGDVPGAVEHAKKALDLLPEGDYFERGLPSMLAGLGHWAAGDLDAAHDACSEGLGYMGIIAICGRAVLADVRSAQGRLSEAADIFRQAIQEAREYGEPQPLGVADLYVGFSDIELQRGDLEAAHKTLIRSKDLGNQAALEDFHRFWCIAMARVKQAQGDLDTAIDLLDEADRLYIRNPSPDLRPVAAIKARVWIRQNRLPDAVAWVEEKGLSVDDELSYLREFEHVTLAKLLIAKYRSDGTESSIEQAVQLLDRLLEAAEEGGRYGSVIEILAQEAMAYEAQDDIDRALVPLERALTLGEPEGYVQVFVDEGEAMSRLLRHAASSNGTSNYARRLLSAFGESTHTDATQNNGGTAHSLPEPLTARETEVLRTIAGGMRNQEIADHLYISLSTVKRHIANAYRKLDVSHRTEAIARANELDLL